MIEEINFYPEEAKSCIVRYTRCDASGMGYIKFNNNEITETKLVDEIDLILDYDKNKRVVGIEFLNSERMPEAQND